MQALFAHRVVHIHRMDEAAVIPQQQITDPPFMMVLVFWARDALVNLVQQGVAFRPLPADHTISAIGIEIKGLTTRILMCSDKRMNDIGRLVFFLLGAYLGAARGPLGVITVHGREAIDLPLPIVREILIGLPHVGKFRLATGAWNDDGLQHRRTAWSTSSTSPAY